MTSVYDTNGQILLAVIGFVVFVLFLFWLWLICKKRRNYQGKIINLIIIFIDIVKVTKTKNLSIMLNTNSKNPFLVFLNIQKNEFQNCENF